MQTCGNSFSLFLVCSYFSFLSFLPHSNKQTRQRTKHISHTHRERERGRERSTSLSSIYPPTFLSIHHHVQQGTSTRIYRSSNLQLSPRAFRTPRPSSHPRRMDSTCCRYVISFIQILIICSRVVRTPQTKNIRSHFFYKKSEISREIMRQS